jgi:hypothetical protein
MTDFQVRSNEIAAGIHRVNEHVAGGIDDIFVLGADAVRKSGEVVASHTIVVLFKGDWCAT